MAELISDRLLAKSLAVDAARLNEIVRGRRGITADTALRLARTVVEESVAALAAMRCPADFHAALFAQGLDGRTNWLPITLPVSDKNVLPATEIGDECAQPLWSIFAGSLPTPQPRRTPPAVFIPQPVSKKTSPRRSIFQSKDDPETEFDSNTG